MYDVGTSLVLFLLIYFFYKHLAKRTGPSTLNTSERKQNIQKFIKLKRILAAVLVPVLIVLAIVTFYNWAASAIDDSKNGIETFNNINNIFFDEFFTILIIVDVLLLLASFFYSDKFHKIIRNSGFVISTILIKISFSAEGLVNNGLIILAVLFGYLIMIIHNKFEQDALATAD
jgi:hypothetical protein